MMINAAKTLPLLSGKIPCTLVALLLFLLPALPVAALAQQVEEYHVKAVFLSNLTHFVNWPADAGEEKKDFVIGIYGPDPFDSVLDKVVIGEKKDYRPVKVERYAHVEELAKNTCKILFIHSSKIREWPVIRRRLSGVPVLTVADVAGFPEDGGMVNLLKTGQKIQVEINHGAVRQSGLFMSSKLLSLARIVQ